MVNKASDKTTSHADLSKGKSLGSTSLDRRGILFKARRHYQGCEEADVEAAMSLFGLQMSN